jgi:hypothetical protein
MGSAEKRPECKTGQTASNDAVGFAKGLFFGLGGSIHCVG